MTLPLPVGNLSLESEAIAESARAPIPPLEVWFADSWSRACYGRSEIGSRPLVTEVRTKKMVAKSKRKKHRRLFAGRVQRGRKHGDAVERLWSDLDREAIHALNLSSPLAKLSILALEEPPLDSDPTIRLVGGLNFETVTGDIPAYEETVGKFKRNHFSGIRARLERLRADAKKIDTEVGLAVAAQKREPRLIAHVALKPRPPTQPHKEPAPERMAAPARMQAQPASAVVPAMSVASKAAVAPATFAPVTAASPEELASAEAAPVPGEPTLVVPKSVMVASTGPVVSATPYRSIGRAVVTNPGGTALGALEIDEDIVDWLEAKSGHIELYLHPIRSPDPQDTIFLNYQYPAERFRIDTRGLQGEYRLMASLFAKDEKTPVAQIGYPSPISVDTYRRKIQFRITRSAINATSARRLTHVGGVLMSATVFEGASGDYRAPKPIPGAVVSLVGLGEHPEYRADAEGNIRVPRVPAHSEVLLKVSAPGFHPTLTVVPTFDGDVYAPIYLVSRDKVSTITNFFAKNPQKASQSAVLGRVFDPVKRVPKEDEKLVLSSRKSKPLYFGSLPDPSLSATTQTGLFAFFNVTPSFRSLRRVESSVRAMLLNLMPDFGYYVELGRGGIGKLRGKLFDPFHGQMPPAKVTVVGDPSFSSEVSQGGNFEIPGIDLPPGMLTLEVESEDYPRTWHSIPWNARHQKQVSRLFMMENQIVRDGAASSAKVAMEPGKGTVVGGAEVSFFKGVQHCVTVMLVSADGKIVAKENGPFPLHQTKPTGGALCLTREDPGFAFFNVAPGEYLLKWVNRKGVAFRTHVVRVGADRVSVTAN